MSRPVAGRAVRRVRNQVDNITLDSDSYRAQNGTPESGCAPLRRWRKRLSFHAFWVPDALSSVPSPSSTLDRLISSREQGRLRCSAIQNAARGCPCAALSSAPEPCPGTRCRGPTAADPGTGPGATRDRGCVPFCGCLGFVRTSPDGSVSPQGRVRRGCASGVRWQRGRPGPVGFFNDGHWRCLFRGCRTEAGPDPAFSVLRSSLLANRDPHG